MNLLGSWQHGWMNAECGDNQCALQLPAGLSPLPVLVLSLFRDKLFSIYAQFLCVLAWFNGRNKPNKPPPNKTPTFSSKLGRGWIMPAVCGAFDVCDTLIGTLLFIIQCLLLTQIMGFSSESVAAFIAVLGILSIIAQVSSCSAFHWLDNSRRAERCAELPQCCSSLRWKPRQGLVP